MIYSFYIIHENKLISSNFVISKQDNNITIKPYLDKTIIKVPIYNKYCGLLYYPIYFPLVLPLFNNIVFNPYIILSSSNLNIDNEIDFFYSLFKIIKNKFNHNYYVFDDLFNKELNLFHNINNYYNNNIIMKNILIDKEIPNIIWLNINIIVLTIIYKIIKKSSLQKNIFLQKIHNFKYLLLLNTYVPKTFSEYYELKKKLDLSDLEKSNTYFISYHNQSKISKVTIKIIHDNSINIGDKDILFEDCDWYLFNPIIDINKNSILYYTFINKSFITFIINQLFNNDMSKIYEYFMNNLTHDIIYIIDNNTNYDSIILSNNYTSNYFKNIINKYKNDNDKIINIFKILFKNYKYPLKLTKHELDDIFDNIIYISLYNILYGSNIIFDNIDINTITSDSVIYNLNPLINDIIPNKLKNLYINLLKTILKLINDNYESIIFNQRFYNDTLYKNILKIFINPVSKQLSIKLFNNLININKLNKIKDYIIINSLLINISNKLNWNNLNKKFNYINYFYTNQDILYYQNRINKNVISPNLDIKIVKIIENPFEMYKYLKKEKDFIKWTIIINKKINDIFFISNNKNIDYNKIGKMIFLLYNIKEQNIKDISYKNFLDFCNENEDIVLHPSNNRINIKIKEFFYLKININLGFLAKHLLFYKNNIDNDNDNNVDKLTIKYNKYKNKYLKYRYKKDVDTGSDTSNY
jgi:hypothetical protein